MSETRDMIKISDSVAGVADKSRWVNRTREDKVAAAVARGLYPYSVGGKPCHIGDVELWTNLLPSPGEPATPTEERRRKR
jgi:hypothetical protein